MEISLEYIEFFLLILVRITGFVYTAPFFSSKNVPTRVKVGISFLLALIVYDVVQVHSLEYENDIQYFSILIKEAIYGVVIGYFANISYYILTLAGHLFDTEIGFSMANTFDPVSNISVTITSNLYSYLVMLAMMITNLHHYFIRGIVDSYTVIPVGEVVINTEIYKLMIQFVMDFFIIGFRIVLPVFASILIVNVVLGILAKVAPQMNMFVIGMQLKVLIGLIVLYFVIQLVPSVADYIFNEMIDMMRQAIYSFTG